MRWFTADTHFGDEVTFRRYKRPFRTLKEHDQIIVHRWRQCVKPDDIVYHLGDFGDPNVALLLPGQLKLVLGNHDNPKDFDSSRVEILGKVHQVDIKGMLFQLVHNRKKRDLLGPKRYLCGHEHRNTFFFHPVCPGLNVGVDCHFFNLVSEEDVLYWFQTLLEDCFNGRNTILNY